MKNPISNQIEIRDRICEQIWNPIDVSIGSQIDRCLWSEIYHKIRRESELAIKSNIYDLLKSHF